MQDILKGYLEKKSKVEGLIDEHFNDVFVEKNEVQKEYAVASADLIDYMDRCFKHFMETQNRFTSISMDIFIHMKSLQLIYDSFNVDVISNEEKSRKWFINALVMCILHGWDFDGVKFTKGEQVKYKQDILK